MKKLSPALAGMMATILSNHQQYIEQLRADSKSKYGIVQKMGLNIPFVSPKRLAAQFETSVKTFERLRKKGGGPPWVKICTKQIRYPIVTLDAWIDEKINEALSDSE